VSNRFKKSVESAIENTAENMVAEKEEKEQAGNNEEILDTIINNENILNKIMGNTNKKRGSAHTIYLSDEVGSALIQYAKKSKKSKSMLTNEILREVLLKGERR